MRSAANKEMQYLGALAGRSSEDANLVRELGRRLEALRRYDQFFCNADWKPKAPRPAESNLRSRAAS